MDVHFLIDGAVKAHDLADLGDLMGRDDGFAWIDVPELSERHEAVLADLIGLHPMALRSCRERNHVPTIHGYSDHVFIVVHSPLAGDAGHVHLLELDVVIGERFLVTVHGPLNPVVPLDAALVETRGTLARIEAGRFQPRSPAELAYAVLSGVARRQRGVIGEVAEDPRA